MAHLLSDENGKLHRIAGNSSRAHMPLGMIFASSVILDETFVKCCNGQSLSIDGVYKAFCDWLMSKGADVPTCNISTYATEMTTYGQCGKYVINNTSSAQTSGSYTVPAHSIKLPTITEFVASNNGGDAIGLAELDMFKKHGHTIWTDGITGSGSTQAISASRVTGGTPGWSAVTTNTGDSETRPKNIRYPYYVVVAQGVQPIALANMKNKSDKDASNLSDTDVESWRDKLKVVDIIWSGHFGVANNAQLILDIPEDAKLLVIGNCEDSTARNGIVLSVNNPRGEIYTWNVQNQGNTFLKSCSYTKSGNTITFSNCRERINFGTSNTYNSLAWHIEWVGVIR